MVNAFGPYILDDRRQCLGIADVDLIELNEAILARPDGFSVNPRLGKLLEKRRDAMGADLVVPIDDGGAQGGAGFRAWTGDRSRNACDLA